MTIEQLLKDSARIAEAHGFQLQDFAIEVALMHSELSEALEEYRKGTPFLYYKEGKPEGIAAELADVVIRICQTCERFGVPLEEAIRVKQEYNETRPYKHGGKRI